MTPGFQGIEWGVHHARLYDTPGEAMNIGRFMFAGCIDATERIPGGGCRSEWYPEIGEHVPMPIELQREPHHSGVDS